jgi:hypothetical protein
MTVLALLLALHVAAPAQLHALPQQPQNARELLHRARSAEADYERALRWYAPVSAGGLPETDRCDEHVGRFCLFFDDSEENRPIPPTNPAVVVARRAAVSALRRAFAAAPGDRHVADALIRYLAEDGRGDEAVAAARTFRWASADSAWSGLLLGFALHAAGQDSAADVAFADALTREPPAERSWLQDVGWLLDGDERSRYHALDTTAKRAYERRLWILADPLYLQPGNPAYAEHLSRHVWARLLPDSPWVHGMISWGKDLEQLTIRYGVPVARERVPGTWLTDYQFIERYDPNQIELVPEALVTGDALQPPPPGAPSPFDPKRPRSGHVPTGLRKLLPLADQITRFPVGDSIVVRADGAMPLDSADAGPVDAGVFLLDAATLEAVAEQRAAATVSRDTAQLHFMVTVPRDSLIYSLEGFQPATRLGARARFALGPLDHAAAGGAGSASLKVSDILVCDAFALGAPLPRTRTDPALHARAPLVLQPSDTLGLYAEAWLGAAAGYHVELSLERLDRPGFAGRALGWIGRRLGLGGSHEAPRIGWDAVATTAGTTPIAVNLELAGAAPGLYAVTLQVRDGDGARRESRRVVRVAEHS